MSDVFISYKSEEYDEANWLRMTFETNGISCWMAPACIPGGSSYALEIPKAIKECRVFVLVLSKRAQASVWVSKEVDRAINEGKTVLPFMLENFPLRDDFNFYLTNVQRYEAYEKKEAAIEKMVTDINNLLGRKPQEKSDNTESKPEPKREEPKKEQPEPKREEATAPTESKDFGWLWDIFKKADILGSLSLLFGVFAFLYALVDEHDDLTSPLSTIAMSLSCIAVLYSNLKGGKKWRAVIGLLCAALAMPFNQLAYGSSIYTWIYIPYYLLYAVTFVELFIMVVATGKDTAKLGIMPKASVISGIAGVIIFYILWNIDSEGPFYLAGWLGLLGMLCSGVCVKRLGGSYKNQNALVTFLGLAISVLAYCLPTLFAIEEAIFVIPLALYAAFVIYFIVKNGKKA